jgi:hypothetical protein
MGGHSTTSPDGRWTISVTDESEFAVETLKLEVFQAESHVSISGKPPVLTFKSPLPGFDARASTTNDTWSSDGRECHLQLATYHGEASLIVVPSEFRVEFDPLSSFGYIRPIDPVPWFLMFGVLLLAYILGMHRLKARKPH